MGRNVGDAAAQAVERGKSKAKIERTTEQVIADVGKLIEASLFVPPLDVKVLYQAYISKCAELAAIEIGKQAAATATFEMEEEIQATLEMEKAIPLLLKLADNPEFVVEMAKQGCQFNKVVLDEMRDKVATQIAKDAGIL